MRALHLISGLMDGGGQAVALELAGALRRRAGIEAEVGLIGCSSERLRAAAAFVVDYDGNYASMRSLAATAWRLRVVLRRRRYDIVHSHGWDADTIGRWALGEGREPQLVHLHVTPGWIHSTGFRQRVRRLMTRHLFAARQVAIAAVSHAVREHWAGPFPEAAARMRVVHNGVDIERFRPAADDLPDNRPGPGDRPLVLGAACRLAPQKGLPALIEVLPRVLAAAGSTLRLDIAGEGPERAALEARIAALGLTDHVRLRGRVEDMPAFYRAIDLLVLPAVSDEGLPLAVLEAMACAVPVVATDVGGTREAVRDRIDGRIVPPRCPEALAGAIGDLVADPARRRAMGAEACRRARQDFALACQTDKIAALYRELVGGESREGEPIAA